MLLVDQLPFHLFGSHNAIRMDNRASNQALEIPLPANPSAPRLLQIRKKLLLPPIVVDHHLPGVYSAKE